VTLKQLLQKFEISSDDLREVAEKCQNPKVIKFLVHCQKALTRKTPVRKPIIDDGEPGFLEKWSKIIERSLKD